MTGTSEGQLRQFEVSFDPFARLDDGASFGEAELRRAAPDHSDILIYIPGWHATRSSARRMTRRVFGLLEQQLGRRAGEMAAVAIDWPLFLFPEDDPGSTVPTPSNGAQLAAALGPAFPDRQFELDELGDLLDRQPSNLAELRRFHKLATSLAQSPSQAQEDSGPAAAFSAPTVSLLSYAAAMSKTAHPDRNDRDPLKALWAGAGEVLRILAYYELSNRAGVLGRTKLAPMIRQLGGGPGRPRIHLVGHSYGARMAAWALRGLDDAGAEAGSMHRQRPVKSLCLLQGAMSHFAFTDRRPLDHAGHGALADVAALVDGPLISTYSRRDRLLSWWYPIASMLDHEECESAEDLAYRWGAMGYDGLQGEVPLDRQIGPVGTAYEFEDGLQYRVDASSIIATNQSALCGAHSDIVRPELMWLVAAATGGAGKDD